MTIFLALDDTDALGSRGTGRLARAVAETIAAEFPVTGVTRHQLFVHPSIPYTSHNSCAVIHVDAEGKDVAMSIFESAEKVMLGDFIEGSDPGVAVACTEEITPALVAFGKDAKTTVLTQEKARILAKNLKIPLKGLGGTEDGVIGAMAGLGLASTGNDGRFLQIGDVRKILGPASARDLISAGIDEIHTIDGYPVTEGLIISDEGKSVKPCPVHGRCVLFVELRDGSYHAVKRD